MTIGEKIKYCRKQIGITQDKLAELTGIHPVSIRKYETNKMQPQPPQLEKIAAALGVSYNALNGSDTAGNPPKEVLRPKERRRNGLEISSLNIKVIG